METDKTRVLWEESVRIAASRVAIEGVLRLPEGMEEMAAVADVSGEVETEDIKVADGRLTINGRVRFTVLYANMLGFVDSFESESRFTHTEDDPLFKNGMEAVAAADVRRASVRIQDGRCAALRAELMLDIFAARNAEKEVLAAGKCSGAEVLCESMLLPVCAGVKSTRIVMERSVRIPQTMPRMERVLLSRGRASVRRAVRDEGDLAIEGDVCADVVYLSEDKNAPLMHLRQILPFGDVLAGAGAEEVCADARVEKMGVYADPDDSDSLIIRITLAVLTSGQNFVQTEIIKDMYSRKCGMELEKEDICFARRRGLPMEKKVIRMNVEVPEESPEPARVLYACGRMETAEPSAEEGDGTINCEAMLTLVAATEAGTRGINVPVTFELLCPMEADRGSIRVYVDEVNVSGAGRSLEAAIAVELCSESMERHTVKAVCGAVEKEAVKAESGVVVYFADGRETLWDIAKHFRVRRDSLAADMAAGDIVPKGTRLIMLK